MPTKSFGTKVSADFTSNQTGDYTLLSNRVTINGPKFKVRHKESTNHDSPDGYSEFYPTGVKDAGTISGQMHFNPGGTITDSLLALIDTPRVIHWQVEFVDAAAHKYTGEGILDQFDVGGMDADGFLVCDFNIQLSGKMTVTSN